MRHCTLRAASIRELALVVSRRKVLLLVLLVLRLELRLLLLLMLHFVGVHPALRRGFHSKAHGWGVATLC